MTPAERRLVLSLVTAPMAPAELSPEEFLRRFGASDGQALGLHLLRDAVARRNSVDVEMALIVCSVFGVTEDHLDPLLQLASASWYVSNEDVVTQLGRLRTPEAVDALYEATQWVPAYLDFDESRALATKAIWAMPRYLGTGLSRRYCDSSTRMMRSYANKQRSRSSAGRGHEANAPWLPLMRESLLS